MVGVGIRLTEARTTDRDLAEWLRKFAFDNKISQSKVIIMAIERLKAEQERIELERMKAEVTE